MSSVEVTRLLIDILFLSHIEYDPEDGEYFAAFAAGADLDDFDYEQL